MNLADYKSMMSRQEQAYQQKIDQLSSIKQKVDRDIRKAEANDNARKAAKRDALLRRKRKASADSSSIQGKRSKSRSKTPNQDLQSTLTQDRFAQESEP